MKNSITLLLLLHIVGAYAQVQWANKVVKVSSQRSTTKGGAANQALGKPNCFPQKEAGQSRAVWKPAMKTPAEFIQVSFENPIKIKQVIVAENKRPGALMAVFAYDSLNKEYELKKINPQFIEENLNDICASIQYTIVQILMDKLKVAVKETGIKRIAIGGGVSANSGVRDALKEAETRHGWTTFIPAFEFTTDNAAMIAIVGHLKYLEKNYADQTVMATARLKL